MQSTQKTTFSFLQIHTKNVLWAKSTVLPTTMPNCAFLPTADFTFYCSVKTKSCYGNWTHCVSHINMWTLSIDCSSIDSVNILLSRKVKCLTLCKEQSFLIQGTEEWTECPAPRERDWWWKSTGNIYWASSKRQNQRKALDQSVLKELKKLKKKQKSNWK